MSNWYSVYYKYKIYKESKQRQKKKKKDKTATVSLAFLKNGLYSCYTVVCRVWFHGHQINITMYVLLPTNIKIYILNKKTKYLIGLRYKYNKI